MLHHCQLPAQSAIIRITIPQQLAGPFPAFPPNNRIDELVLAKLKVMGIPPSDLCTDAVFLRRVYLDTIGLLPTPDEARAFLADKEPQKRARLIDRLLDRDEFADYWTLKWGDLLRIKAEYPVKLWPKAAQCYAQWLRDSIATNKPADELARELITATGSNFRVGPANFMRAVNMRDPQSVAEEASLVFMGVAMSCAMPWPSL